MDHLTRYIFRQSIALTSFVTLVLTGAVLLITSLKLVELVVDRGEGTGIFIKLMVLSLPQILQLVLPIGCFIGVLFTYNKMITDSELVVMRACGLSQAKLARPALIVAIIGVGAMLSLSVYFLPASKNAFKDLQFAIRNQFTSVILQEGTFNPVSDTLTVYARSRDSTGHMQGLLIEDLRDRQKPVTLTAESGLIVQVDGVPRVIMNNGTRQSWDDEKGLSSLAFDRYSLNLDEFHDAPGARVPQADERYLPDLFNPADAAGDPVLYDRLIVEGHNRLVSPLYCMTYVLIGLACLLTGELNRRGQGKRMLTAISIIVVLVTLSFWTTNLANRNAGAIPLMYLNALLPMPVSILLILVGYQPFLGLLSFRRAAEAGA
ncbi:MAG TPA: LPS export ABC transporter permease LptF [Aliidongia sp.]|nr:LPS export ABC transporter permease LptF [Aliidongia sp.]